MKITNVLIVGVGGQGVILASEILTEVAIQSGLDAKKSEVHGMAQRGGVVYTHVRFGEKVYSPLIEDGKSEVMLAFEEVEAWRWKHQVTENGKILVNAQRIIPSSVTSAGLEYPDALKKLQAAHSETYSIPGFDICDKQIGNTKLVNTVLLGALSTTLNFPEENWLKVIRKRVPKGTEEMNEKAFQLGREAMNK